MEEQSYSRDGSAPEPKLRPALCRGIAVLAGVTALVRVAVTIPTFTNIVDEPFHVAAAVALWETGKHTHGVEHPPLPRLVAGLPLYVAGVRLPAESRGETIRGELESTEAGARILFNSPALGYWQMLVRARLAMLVFPALGLVYLYLLARWAGGEAAGMLAVLFVSVDPTFLGHAFWVTTDAAAAAGFLAATFHGLRWVHRPTWTTALAAGAALGLAIACKFTGLLLVPGLLLIVLIRAIGRAPHSIPRLSPAACGGFLDAPKHENRSPKFEGNSKREIRRTETHRRPRLFEFASLRTSSFPRDSCFGFRAFARQALLVALVAFVTLWATYLFDVGTIADQRVFREHSPQWQKIPAWIKQAPVPMPSLALGVMRVLSHNRFGHVAYLNGQISRYGWWYYFPEAIALKSPLALLIGLLVAIGAMLWLRARGLGRALQVALVGAVFLAFAMWGNLNIGIRHVLPLIPLLYLVAVVALLRARLAPVLVGLVALAGFETSRQHPDYLAHFNLAAGGPAHADQFLIDSNLDWGQDVGRLARWMRSPEAAGKPYALRLFAYPPRQVLSELGLDPDALDRRPTNGLLIISKNIRHGLTSVELLPDGTMRRTSDYAWLARYPLVKRIGRSIEVYDLCADPDSTDESPQSIVRK